MKDGWEGAKQQDSLSQRQGKQETLMKTNPPGIKSCPSVRRRLSDYFFPELNSLMELKKKTTKTTFKAGEKCALVPTHAQQAVISSNCKGIIRFPLGEMLVKKQNKVSEGTPA